MKRGGRESWGWDGGERRERTGDNDDGGGPQASLSLL